MQAILKHWNDLPPVRRIGLVAALLVLLATLAVIVSLATRPTYSLLYSQLDDRSAGGVLRALDQRGIAYDVRGGAIYVAAEQRDSLRLDLAAEGLPAVGARGYELLDSLTGFGTTAQMFDAAYWRAKEGELARTILSSPDIAAVRVHIAQGTGGPFSRDAASKASVFVSAASGSISPELARALRFLVASAVLNLDPDDVSIVDGTGRLIGLENDSAAQSDANAQEAMRTRIQRLVEARVGPGNAVVELSVDRVSETESILERRIDPQSRVAISIDSEERVGESQNGGAAVSVSSDLPDGDAASDNGSSQNTEARERINYAVSETTREVRREAGEIKRITVAVLVNASASTVEGQATNAVTQDDLSNLEALVASAIGFDAARGDEVTIRSMPFDARSDPGTLALPGFWQRQSFDLGRLAQLGVLGAIALLLGLFVVRPLLAGGRTQIATVTDREAPAALPNNGNSAVPSDLASVPSLLPAQIQDEPEDPVERLRGLIDSRRDETVEVIRSWLDEKEAAS